jgi:hypothetical protein
MNSTEYPIDVSTEDPEELIHQYRMMSQPPGIKIISKKLEDG